MSTVLSQKAAPRASMIDRIERFGDKVPHPFYLFIFLCLGVMVLSWLLAIGGGGVTHPATGELVHVKNLLSGEGWCISSSPPSTTSSHSNRWGWYCV